MTNVEIASTILQQLGGGRFTTMTGAYNYVAGDADISFRLPAGAREEINLVRVILEANDTYRMQFLKWKRSNFVQVREVGGVYSDMLGQVFTDVTGLDVTL
jgi:hypothetical protein